MGSTAEDQLGSTKAKWKRKRDESTQSIKYYTQTTTDGNNIL